MGTITSKKLTARQYSQFPNEVSTDLPEEAINQPSNMTPLQNAVLRKNYSEARQLLSESEGVSEVTESGLTLLHLALVQNPPNDLCSERYYDYLRGNKNSIQKGYYTLIRDMLELLCSRGAPLREDRYRINPLEAIHYCSNDTSASEIIVNALTSYTSLTCTHLVRYSVCRLVYHKCEHFNSKVPSLRIIKCSISELKKDLLNSMALFVKHGLELDNIPGKFTSVYSAEVIMHSVRHNIQKRSDGNKMIIDNGPDAFELLEYKLNIWQHLWNMSDPLSFTFNSDLVAVLRNKLEDDNADGIRSKKLFEVLITTWLEIPSLRYPMLSEEVVIIIRHLYSYLSSITNRRKPPFNPKNIVNLSKLNRLLYLLVKILSTKKNMTDDSSWVKMSHLSGFYIHKWLMERYGVIQKIPYEEMNILSASLSTLFKTTPNALSYLNLMLDYQSFDNFLDKREFLGFHARFDPDLNARRLDNGRTPLHDALLFGDIFLIQTLIENGANPFTVDKDGNSFVEQLSNIIDSLNIGPARQLYQETRDQYIILNPPFPLLTLAANVITRKKIPFDILSCQPRLYNMLLSYLPLPT